MMKKKRALTLLEIMIVIALITLISGVIGYNMKGTLEKGRAFRTEQAKEQLRDMISLCMADGTRLEEILQNQGTIKNNIEKLGLAKDVDKILKDGWGYDFEITLNENGSDFEIQSKKLFDFNEAQKK